MFEQDTIGVVREHRWLKPEAQAKRLEQDGCRIIVSLAGGKQQPVTRDELEKLVRPGTVIKFVYAFLLAEPKRRPAQAMKGDLATWMGRLIDRRGGIIKDVDTGLTTELSGHRKAIIAIADDMIALHCKGAKSAAISKARKGRPLAEFTPQQLKDAKAIWRNAKDYPRWQDVEAAFAREVPGFTTARAFRLWQGRN